MAELRHIVVSGGPFAAFQISNFSFCGVPELTACVNRRYLLRHFIRTHKMHEHRGHIEGWYKLRDK